ncbi:hypothetical protein KC357_g26 [Hortaea werneckii]|nr:hypothetical protein KC357_g26 [Hortaea werneckii]
MADDETIDSPTCHASGDPELLHAREAQRLRSGARRIFTCSPDPLDTVRGTSHLIKSLFHSGSTPLHTNRRLSKQVLYIHQGHLTENTQLPKMDDFASDTDSDYTSYWRDWWNFQDTSSVHTGLYTKRLACPRLAGLHDKFFLGPPPPSSQPNDEDTDMPTYYSQSENTEVADYVQEFISSRGNEYFCEIDEDYLTDRFNLTGLNTEVQHYHPSRRMHATSTASSMLDMSSRREDLPRW